MWSSRRIVGAAWLLSSALLVSFYCPGAGDWKSKCLGADACGAGGCPAGDCCLGCQRVSDHKPIKKTVYACKVVPYCLPRCKNPLRAGQSCCESCEAHPRWKRILLKREVVVGCTCGTKCEVMCLTHGGSNGAACGSAGTSPGTTEPPAPAAYDAEPAPSPAAR